MAKLSIAAVIFLGGAFFFMRSVLPVLMELAHPGSQSQTQTQTQTQTQAPTPALNAAPESRKTEEKAAPTGVQVIRQTREVMAKSDANVAYLNAIVDGIESPPTTAKPVSPPPVSKPREPEVKINLKSANRLIADLPITGVIGGANPRIIVNGLLVNVDDVVDWRLGLVFAGVDETARMILFRHKDGTLLRRRY